MAVAQAQHKVRELYDQLKKRGITVKFAIHPVAGRMPGHMNVLLAEADIPYTDLVEMDEINPDMPQVDVALVIGANDVVNPAARTDKTSPIYGMPIIDADKARTIFAIKRSKNPGFAGIDNELYFSDRTLDALRRREGGRRRAGEAAGRRNPGCTERAVQKSTTTQVDHRDTEAQRFTEKNSVFPYLCPTNSKFLRATRRFPCTRRQGDRSPRPVLPDEQPRGIDPHGARG